MSKKKGDGSGNSNKLMTTVAMAGGVFLLRKLLAVVWTKATGKTPPTDINDPEVKLPELLAWSIATGLVIESARFAIVRATARRQVTDGTAE
jgi:uncharacterized protein DUF4235